MRNITDVIKEFIYAFVKLIESLDIVLINLYDDKYRDVIKEFIYNFVKLTEALTIINLI